MTLDSPLVVHLPNHFELLATLCCAIINDLKTANVRSISTYTQQYPELKWLVKCRRLLVISERPEGLHIDCESEDILIEWLAGESQMTLQINERYFFPFYYNNGKYTDEGPIQGLL